MKLNELKALANRLNDFSHISRARRVENNSIEITFDKRDSYFFDMTRGHSTVYKADSKRPLQGYNAPFDTLLHGMLSAGKIISVDILDNDRVLRIEVAAKSSYKDKVIVLQLEFTGKNTNAILLDENGVIIEALRHIDSDSSFRVVRPGVELANLPAHESKVDEEAIINIDALLLKRNMQLQSRKLKQLKQQKVSLLQKKIAKLSIALEKLPNRQKLDEQHYEYQNIGNILLANLHQIKPYDTKLEVCDFNGEPISIKFPKGVKVNRLSDYYFSLSKRSKNKAKNIHIEQQNLTSKREFYENILHAVSHAPNAYEIELLVPKRAKQQKRKEKLRDGELFWIEDYKVYVGRNSNENKKLLGLAKANDLWMHIQGVPSSHVIIRTDKQNLPESVIRSAAKLCVDFSVKRAGDYKVDYTKRKFVRVQEGSNVLYNKYDTITVTKEGVENRE